MPSKTALTDARDEARRVLAIGVGHSFLWAGKFAVGAAVILGVILGAMASLQWLTGSSFVSVLVVYAALVVVTWVVAELHRLGQRSDSLQRLLDSEKMYEELIDEARKERDEIAADRDTLRGQYMLVLAARSLVVEEARLLTRRTATDEEETDD